MRPWPAARSKRTRARQQGIAARWPESAGHRAWVVQLAESWWAGGRYEQMETMSRLQPRTIGFFVPLNAKNSMTSAPTSRPDAGAYGPVRMPTPPLLPALACVRGRAPLPPSPSTSRAQDPRVPASAPLHFLTPMHGTQLQLAATADRFHCNMCNTRSSFTI